MTLHRRAATPADLDRLLALRRESMDAHLRNSGASTSEADHRERLMHAFEHAQVLELDGEPIGLLKVVRQPPAWHLVQIQLEGHHRGAGLGTLLVEQVIEEAAQAGCDIRLGVLKANPAKRLYERLGFVVIAEGEHGYTMHRHRR